MHTRHCAEVNYTDSIETHSGKNSECHAEVFNRCVRALPYIASHRCARLDCVAGLWWCRRDVLSAVTGLHNQLCGLIGNSSTT